MEEIPVFYFARRSGIIFAYIVFCEMGTLLILRMNVMSEKQKENGKVHLKGQLRLYMQWPAVMALLLVAMNIWIYRIDRRAGS